MKPFIDQAFWSDPDIEGAKAGVKLTALWLITNSQTNLLGVCGASESRFRFETGLDDKALTSTLEALPRAFVRVGGVIFVRNYVRHQFGSGDKLKRNNFFVALKSLFLGIKDDRLRDLIVTEYPEFKEALAKGFEGLMEPKERKGKERAGEDRGDEVQEKRARFIKPTIEEVESEMTAKGLGSPKTEAEQFMNHFNSNGWKVGGKAPMKDWRASVATWAHRNNGNATNGHRLSFKEEAQQREIALHKTPSRFKDANGNPV